MYALKNRDNDGTATSAEISLAFFNQQGARHGRTMDDRTADDKIAVAIRGTIGNGCPVNFERVFRHDQTKLRRDKMLQHSTEILCTGILTLAFFRLLKQFIQICSDSFRRVCSQNERLISKVFTHLLGPKVLDHGKIHGFFCIPFVQKVHVLNHQAHATPAGSPAFGGQLLGNAVFF